LNDLLISEQAKFSLSCHTESVQILTAMATDVIKWYKGTPASKMSNSSLPK